MKLLLTFIFAFYSLFIFPQALYFKPYPKNYLEKKYSRSEISQDISFMITTMKKVHPNFYHSFTETELKNSVDSILNTVKDSIDIYEASLIVGSICAKLNEGHLGLTVNKAIYDTFKVYDKRFPFSLLKITDSVLIVGSDLSISPILKGTDSILSINDIPVWSLVYKFKSYFGGLNNWKESLVKSQFDYLLFASKIHSPFKITAKHEGRQIEFVTEGVLKTPSENNSSDKSNNFYKYSILDKETAYINFFNMSGNYEQFKDSVKETFKDIQDKKINKLIVDLRFNGGGNSNLGEYFLSYINDKPYRVISGTVIKVSKPVKQYVRTFIPWYFKIGSYLVPSGIMFKATVKPKIYKSEPFYSGKTCFLVGVNTFSSANLIAEAILDYKLAPLIGECTGEPCNDYGDMVAFILPNTHLGARVPFKQFFRANGDKSDRNSVVPDYIVVPSPQEIISGKDKVLDFAKELLDKP